MPVTIRTFPPELWGEVFSHLDYKSLKTLESACRTFRSILVDIEPTSTSALSKILLKNDIEPEAQTTAPDPLYGHLGMPVIPNHNFEEMFRRMAVWKIWYHLSYNVCHDDHPPHAVICAMVPLDCLVVFAEALIRLLDIVPASVLEENACSPPQVTLAAAVDIRLGSFWQLEHKGTVLKRREGGHGGIKVISVIKGFLSVVHGVLDEIFNNSPQLNDKFRAYGGCGSREQLLIKLDAIKAGMDGLPE